MVEEDCIGLLWALSGEGKGSGRRRKGLKHDYAPRQFDLVVADPPAFSKGKFAAVDLVRDPETIFAPAWQVVAPGGVLVAANNSARVTRAEFEQRLRKMIQKRGDDCARLEWVEPDSDFPSFDGEPPLKVAFCWKT
jgi:23S rRNA (cytosine1962-C5)-methyltransferase